MVDCLIAGFACVLIFTISSTVMGRMCDFFYHSSSFSTGVSLILLFCGFIQSMFVYTFNTFYAFLFFVLFKLSFLSFFLSS